MGGRRSYQTFAERIKHGRKMKDKEYSDGLKRRYNIDLEEKIKMARKQEYKCANLKCNNYLSWNVKKIHTDHCHITGKVRELLCSGCNTTLGILEGMLNGTNERIKGLIEYRERHKIIQTGTK